MTIGFDLDGIFIDRPFFIPRTLLEWLYRGPQKNGPHYRFPHTRLERFIRRLSHHYLLRPRITANIRFFIRLMTDHPENDYYLISSRYHFLEKETQLILKRYGLDHPNLKVYLNKQNLQPHLFKEKMVNQLKLNLFIDDDQRTALYLQQKCPRTTICWYSPSAKIKEDCPFQTVNKLEEIINYL